MREIIHSTSSIIHDDKIWSLAVGLNGKILITTSADGTSKLFTLSDDGKPLNSEVLDLFSVSPADSSPTREGRVFSIRRAAVAPGVIATAAFDKIIRLYRIETQSRHSVILSNNIEAHDSEVKGVAFSGDGLTLASCGRDRKVKVWSRVIEEDRAIEFREEAIFADHKQDVKCVSITADGQFVASGSYDNSIRLWAKIDGDWAPLDVVAPSSLTETESAPALRVPLVPPDPIPLGFHECYHTDTVQAVEFCPFTSYPLLATASNDGSVRLWKLCDRSLHYLSTSFIHLDESDDPSESVNVYSLAWQKSGETVNLLSAGADGCVAIHEVLIGNETPIFGKERLFLVSDCEINAIVCTDQYIWVGDDAGRLTKFSINN